MSSRRERTLGRVLRAPRAAALGPPDGKRGARVRAAPRAHRGHRARAPTRLLRAGARDLALGLIPSAAPRRRGPRHHPPCAVGCWTVEDGRALRSATSARGEEHPEAASASLIQTPALQHRATSAPPGCAPARRLGHSTAIFPKTANGGTSATRSLRKPPRVVPPRRSRYREAGPSARGSAAGAAQRGDPSAGRARPARGSRAGRPGGRACSG